MIDRQEFFDICLDEAKKANITLSPDDLEFIDKLHLCLVKELQKWPQFVSKFLLNVVMGNEGEYPMTGEEIRELLELQWHNCIAPTTTKAVYEEVVSTGVPYYEIINSRNLWKTQDNSALTTFIKNLVSTNADKAEELRNGKDQLLGWFTGQIMREFKGKVDGKEVQTILKKEIFG